MASTPVRPTPEQARRQESPSGHVPVEDSSESPLAALFALVHRLIRRRRVLRTRASEREVLWLLQRLQHLEQRLDQLETQSEVPWQQACDMGVVAAREAADMGARVSLDDLCTKLGFDRDELEAELDAESR